MMRRSREGTEGWGAVGWSWLVVNTWHEKHPPPQLSLLLFSNRFFMSVLGKTTLLLCGGVRMTAFICGGGGGLSLHISHICIFPVISFCAPCLCYRWLRLGTLPAVQPLLHLRGVDFPSATVAPASARPPSWGEEPPQRPDALFTTGLLYTYSARRQRRSEKSQEMRGESERSGVGLCSRREGYCVFPGPR